MAGETKEVIILELRVEDGAGGKSAPAQKKEVDALATSILGLQQANKKLREERKLLDTSTAEGAKRISEINAAIDKNDKTIKANSSTLEKQRLNIGNYASALDGLIPGLGGVVDGIGGMTKASYAFIATGIGAVIAALGLALAAVISYFKGSEEGADKFARVSAQAEAVIGVLVDRVVMLGGALVAFLSGDFEGGLNKLEGAFSGVGDEIEREIELAGELADILDELDERELRYALAVSETTNQIKRLIIEAKNRTSTEQERIDKLTQATELEKKHNEELLKIQEDRISATARQIQSDFSSLQSQQQVGESAIDFAKRIVANEGILFDRRKELADLLITYNTTQGESLNIQEKINNQTDQINEKLQEKNDKQKALNDEVARYMEVFTAQLEAQRIQFEQEQAEAEARSKLSERFISDTGAAAKASRDLSAIRIQAAKNASDSEVKFNKASNDLKTKQDLDYARVSAKLATDAAALFQQNTIAYKVLATGRAIANTWLGVTEILKTPSVLPEPAATIARALSIGTAVASGLNAVKEINKVKFAEGGRADKVGIFEGPSHAGGGRDYISADGKHRINVEGGEGFFVLKKSATRELSYLSGLNQKHGGASWGDFPSIKKSYASGGQVTFPTQSRDIDVERIVRTTMANFPSIYVAVTDINDGQASLAEVVDRANIS